MLTQTVTDSVAEPRRSRRRLLLVLLPVLLLAGALAPAPAAAQGGGFTCSADVNATQDPTVANFSVDCGQSNITTVRFTTTEGGSVEGDSGTQCSETDQTTFECQPTGDAAGVITGQFTNARGDAVCADPPLTIDFDVELEGGGTEQIDNVRVANCSQDSGGGGVVDTGEDNSRTPEGGVDSGAGGREAKAAGPGVVSALIAGATVLGLVTAGLLARRRRGAR